MLEATLLRVPCLLTVSCGTRVNTNDTAVRDICSRPFRHCRSVAQSFTFHCNNRFRERHFFRGSPLFLLRRRFRFRSSQRRICLLGHLVCTTLMRGSWKEFSHVAAIAVASTPSLWRILIIQSPQPNLEVGGSPIDFVRLPMTLNSD